VIILKATQEKVLSVLLSVSGIVEKRHTMPILSNILLHKSGGNIQFMTSDLEIQIQTTCALNGDDGEFSTTIGARKIIDVLRSIPPEQTVTLESSQNRVILKAGKSRFTLQTMVSEDFPKVKEASSYGTSFKLPQKTFKQLLNQVSFSMAVHDIRYYLNGILFIAEDQDVRIVATDGHRLAYASAALDHAVSKQEVILPRKTVLELSRLLSDQGGDIEITFASNQARFNFNDMEFITKLVEGKFPDYNRVIPKKQNNTVLINRMKLLACLQRTAILTSDKFKGVRINIEPNVLKVSSSNAEQEEAMDEIDIEYSGANIEIGFNVTYLIDVLLNMTQDNISLDLPDSTSSALITIPENSSFKYVVMPMRI
jgi:DNA polymerase-3 subunit beta